MDLKVVRYEVADRVATITLNRPDRLNAWTGRMHHEYRWAIAEADTDPEVRAVMTSAASASPRTSRTLPTRETVAASRRRDSRASMP